MDTPSDNYSLVKTPNGNDGRDFWLQYSPVSSKKTFTDTLQALYYLPENYKLIIVTQDPAYEMSISEYRDLAKRVQFDSQTGMAEESSPLPSAVIYDDAADNQTPSTPSVIVVENAKQALTSDHWDRFIVSAGKPEALATAALKIARAAA